MSEHAEQQALFVWANSGYTQERYPELAHLFAIPNGGHRIPAVAARMQAEGVRAGVPDICLPVARQGWHGLFIEMKFGRNWTTEEQQTWLDFLTGQGYLARVCRSAEEAQTLLRAYLEEAPTWRPHPIVGYRDDYQP